MQKLIVNSFWGCNPFARLPEIGEIEANNFNLNISRYVSTAEPEVEIELSATHKELVEIKEQIQESTAAQRISEGTRAIPNEQLRRRSL